MKPLLQMLFLSLLLSASAIAQQVTTLADLGERFGDDMLVNRDGDLLISGGYNKQKILKVDKAGEVSVFAEGLPGPVGMGFDSKGNLFVANYTGNSITRISPDGVQSEFASGLDGPAGLFVNTQDEVFVPMYGAKFSGTGATVVKFDAQGNQSVFATGDGLKDVIGIDRDENGRFYVNNFQNASIFLLETGKSTKKVHISEGRINQIAYSNGFLYIPSPTDKVVYRMDQKGNVDVFSGNGEAQIVDGKLLEASYDFPNSIAISDDGKKIYILDGRLGKVRLISL